MLYMVDTCNVTKNEYNIIKLTLTIKHINIKVQSYYC